MVFGKRCNVQVPTEEAIFHDKGKKEPEVDPAVVEQCTSEEMCIVKHMRSSRAVFYSRMHTGHQ